MTIRRKLAWRTSSGRELHMIQGDELPWKYDGERDCFHVLTDDGKAAYLVIRIQPEEKGRYAYWAAGAKLSTPGGIERVDLGDEYLVPSEGREVCQLYESERRQGNIDATKKLEAR